MSWSDPLSLCPSSDFPSLSWSDTIPPPGGAGTLLDIGGNCLGLLGPLIPILPLVTWVIASSSLSFSSCALAPWASASSCPCFSAIWFARVLAVLALVAASSASTSPACLSLAASLPCLGTISLHSLTMNSFHAGAGMFSHSVFPVVFEPSAHWVVFHSLVASKNATL